MHYAETVGVSDDSAVNLESGRYYCFLLFMQIIYTLHNYTYTIASSSIGKDSDKSDKASAKKSVAELRKGQCRCSFKCIAVL